MTSILRPAAATDLDAAINLLREAQLPTADVAAERLAFAAENGGVLQGVIGLEAFGRIALLRSLVVSQDARGSGVGLALVSALEAACVADGVLELWLLTIDADAFFAKHGYKVRDRNDAPKAIRDTREFSGLCPGEAVLMSKSLLAFPVP